MVRRMAIVLAAVSFWVTAVPAAHAEPEPVDKTWSGVAAYEFEGKTSALPPTPQLWWQEMRWYGTTVVVIPWRPTVMQSCSGTGLSAGWVGMESGGIALACNGSGPNGHAALNCELLVLRVGAVMELDGQCRLITPTATHPLIAAGQFEWVPTEVAGQYVKGYQLAGSLALADV